VVTAKNTTLHHAATGKKDITTRCLCTQVTFRQSLMVGWNINVPFQHKNRPYIGDKVLGGDLVLPG